MLSQISQYSPALPQARSAQRYQAHFSGQWTVSLTGESQPGEEIPEYFTEKAESLYGLICKYFTEQCKQVVNYTKLTDLNYWADSNETPGEDVCIPVANFEMVTMSDDDPAMMLKLNKIARQNHLVAFEYRSSDFQKEAIAKDNNIQGGPATDNEVATTSCGQT